MDEHVSYEQFLFVLCDKFYLLGCTLVNFCYDRCLVEIVADCSITVLIEVSVLRCFFTCQSVCVCIVHYLTLNV